MKNIRMFLCFTLSVYLLTGNKDSQAQIMIGETEVDTHSVVTGLDTPWEILWGPDNYIWITERAGKVSRLNPETGELDLLITIPDVHEQSESGLMGMAIHPDFPDTPHVFLIYNYYTENIWARVVRYSFTGSSLDNPIVLLENINGAAIHDGSRLIIDNDYKLFVTIGDAAVSSSAQNINSLNGKILRMNPDGSIPVDNPSGESYVWTWGHRNPQGLILKPDGKMYSSEHGPDNDDELNLIEKGRNYGWPDVHGYCNFSPEINFCNDNNIKEPLFAWTPTLAVAGIDYYNSDNIPEWKNSILMTTLKERELLSLALSIDGQSITGTSIWFDNWFGRLRDLCISPDGRVFIAVSNRDGRGTPVAGDDRIVQIKAKVAPTNYNSKKITDTFKIFPNPMSHQAIIQFNNNIQSGRLIITGLSGKTVRTESFSGTEYLLNRENLSAGYYFLEIICDDYYDQVQLIVL